MRRFWLLVAGCLLLSPREAVAQLGCSGATCTVEISMPVADVLRLSFSSSSVSLGSPSNFDYEIGYLDVSGTAVSVTGKANRPFRVDMSALTATFAYVGPLANPSKPASDLKWATSAAGLASTTNDMGSAATLINQVAGTATVPVYLRTLWNFTKDVPGTYSLAIRFTLSAP